MLCKVCVYTHPLSWSVAGFVEIYKCIHNMEGQETNQKDLGFQRPLGFLIKDSRNKALTLLSLLGIPLTSTMDKYEGKNAVFYGVRSTTPISKL